MTGTARAQLPDERAIRAYVVGGVPFGAEQAPEVPAGAFDGSVEALRDALRSRPQPYGGRAVPDPGPVLPVLPVRQPRRLLRRTPATTDPRGLVTGAAADVPLPTSPPPDVPFDAWFRAHADVVWAVFSSGSFGSRASVDQLAVLRAFHAYRTGRGGMDRWTAWRLLNLELWLREWVDSDPDDARRPPVPLVATPGREYASDAAGRHEQAPPKSDYEPNRYKRILLADGRWARFPLRVDLVAPGDDVPALVARRTAEFFAGLDRAPAAVAALAAGRPWYAFVGEKVVAIAQRRFVLVADIRPGRAARTLAGLVSANPLGIGVSQPETMQVAIDEVGLPRILAAAGAGAVGKVLRRPGWFYRVAGSGVASIDGPADYCAYPANVSAKLAPRDPAGVARAVSEAVRGALPPDVVAGFGGTVVIDSNDIGRDVLGHDTTRDRDELAAAYADNPTGQGREQTPVSLVFQQR